MCVSYGLWSEVVGLARLQTRTSLPWLGCALAPEDVPQAGHVVVGQLQREWVFGGWDVSDDVVHGVVLIRCFDEDSV